MIRICLVKVGAVDSAVLTDVGRALERVLSCEVVESRRSLDPRFAFDSGRGQYWSTSLLDGLEAMRTDDIDRILGIAEVDLFIPIFTFVFGEALLNRPPALISLHRLRPSFYGLPDDPERTLERARREAVHELGHTFGLVHCLDYACVMHASRTADEIDLKGPGFCDECSALLSGATNGIRPLP